MDAVKQFSSELTSLYESKPPVSRAKMTSITKLAMKAGRFYKHIVQAVEKFIQRCQPEYKVPGLYVIDSIVRQSRHQLGPEQDLYAPRFARNMGTTITCLLDVSRPDDTGRVIRVLNLWQKNSIYPPTIVQPLLDLILNPHDQELLLNVNKSVEQFYGEAKAASDSRQSAENGGKALNDGSTGGSDTAGQHSALLKAITQLLQSQAQPVVQPVVNMQQIQMQLLQQQLAQQLQHQAGESANSGASNVNTNSLLEQLQALTSAFVNKSSAAAAASAQQKIAESSPAVTTLPVAPSPTVQKSSKHQKHDADLPKHQSRSDRYGDNDDVAHDDRRRSPEPDLMSGDFIDVDALQSSPSYSSSASSYERHRRSKNRKKNKKGRRHRNSRSRSGSSRRNRRNNRGAGHVAEADSLTSPYRHNERATQRRSSLTPVRNESSVDSDDHRGRKRKKRKRERSAVESRSRSRSQRHRSSASKDRRDRKRNRNTERWGDDYESFPPLKDNHACICSTTLWVGRVSRKTSEEDLMLELSKFGRPKINLVFGRGCAFISFEDRDKAAGALEHLKHVVMHGLELKVAWAPGEGIKKSEFMDKWDVDLGVTYIPWRRLPRSMDSLLEGGSMIQRSLPPHHNTVVELSDVEELSPDLPPLPTSHPHPGTDPASGYMHPDGTAMIPLPPSFSSYPSSAPLPPASVIKSLPPPPGFASTFSQISLPLQAAGSVESSLSGAHLAAGIQSVLANSAVMSQSTPGVLPPGSINPNLALPHLGGPVMTSHAAPMSGESRVPVFNPAVPPPFVVPPPIVDVSKPPPMIRPAGYNTAAPGGVTEDMDIDSDAEPDELIDRHTYVRRDEMSKSYEFNQNQRNGNENEVSSTQQDQSFHARSEISSGFQSEGLRNYSDQSFRSSDSSASTGPDGSVNFLNNLLNEVNRGMVRPNLDSSVRPPVLSSHSSDVSGIRPVNIRPSHYDNSYKLPRASNVRLETSSEGESFGRNDVNREMNLVRPPGLFDPNMTRPPGPLGPGLLGPGQVGHGPHGPGPLGPGPLGSGPLGPGPLGPGPHGPGPLGSGPLGPGLLGPGPGPRLREPSEGMLAPDYLRFESPRLEGSQPGTIGIVSGPPLGLPTGHPGSQLGPLQGTAGPQQPSQKGPQRLLDPLTWLRQRCQRNAEDESGCDADTDTADSLKGSDRADESFNLHPRILESGSRASVNPFDAPGHGMRVDGNAGLLGRDSNIRPLMLNEGFRSRLDISGLLNQPQRLRPPPPGLHLGIMKESSEDLRSGPQPLLGFDQMPPVRLQAPPSAGGLPVLTPDVIREEVLKLARMNNRPGILGAPGLGPGARGSMFPEPRIIGNGRPGILGPGVGPGVMRPPGLDIRMGDESRFSGLRLPGLVSTFEMRSQGHGVRSQGQSDDYDEDSSHRPMFGESIIPPRSPNEEGEGEEEVIVHTRRSDLMRRGARGGARGGLRGAEGHHGGQGADSYGGRDSHYRGRGDGGRGRGTRKRHEHDSWGFEDQEDTERYGQSAERNEKWGREREREREDWGYGGERRDRKERRNSSEVRDKEKSEKKPARRNSSELGERSERSERTERRNSSEVRDKIDRPEISDKLEKIEEQKVVIEESKNGNKEGKQEEGKGKQEGNRMEKNQNENIESSERRDAADRVVQQFSASENAENKTKVMDSVTSAEPTIKDVSTNNDLSGGIEKADESRNEGGVEILPISESVSAKNDQN